MRTKIKLMDLKALNSDGKLNFIASFEATLSADELKEILTKNKSAYIEVEI